jgi:hypothetical protein
MSGTIPIGAQNLAVVIDLTARRYAGSPEVTCRIMSLLRAVAAGRAELTCSRVPDLFVDGMSCANQDTAYELVRDGLIRPARPGIVGQRVRAELTVSGRDLLDAYTKPISA